MITFEEWKKQYCAEPTLQTLNDLKQLYNIKDPKTYILHMQKNAYKEYEYNEWLKDNPSLVIQAEPMKQASDKSTLLGELLDHNIPKSEREHVAAAEIERLNQMLRETGYGQGQIDAYAAQCEEIDNLKAEVEQLRTSIDCLQKERIEAFKLGPHPLEQVLEMPLNVFIATRFVPTWKYNEMGDKIERLNKEIKLQNKDWCDDDEAIKQQALRVLSKEAVEGGSVHVPRMGELAEIMADEIERLREVLQQIVDPIKFIRTKAEQAGLKINGMMASMLSNDANYLKELAEKGLKNES